MLLLEVSLSPLMFQVVIFIGQSLEQKGLMPWFSPLWLGICLALVAVVLWICALFSCLVPVVYIDPDPYWLVFLFGFYFPIAFWLHSSWGIPTASRPFLSSPNGLEEWHRLPIWTIAHWTFEDLGHQGSPPEDFLRGLWRADLNAFLCVARFASRFG